MYAAVRKMDWNAFHLVQNCHGYDCSNVLENVRTVEYSDEQK